jgi:hypothetical protein
MWLGYAAFHNGDYRLAIESYEEHIAKYKALGTDKLIEERIRVRSIKYLVECQ